MRLLLFVVFTGLPYFFRFHTRVLPYSICLSLPDLVQLRCPPRPFTWLQREQFCSLLCLSSIPSCVCVDHSLCIYSSVDGHLGCLHILAIVNKASTNTASNYLKPFLGCVGSQLRHTVLVASCGFQALQLWLTGSGVRRLRSCPVQACCPMARGI